MIEPSNSPLIYDASSKHESASERRGGASERRGLRAKSASERRGGTRLSGVVGYGGSY